MKNSSIDELDLIVLNLKKKMKKKLETFHPFTKKRERNCWVCKDFLMSISLMIDEILLKKKKQKKSKLNVHICMFCATMKKMRKYLKIIFSFSHKIQKVKNEKLSKKSLNVRAFCSKLNFIIKWKFPYWKNTSKIMKNGSLRL